MSTKSKKKKAGPEPETVTVGGDWRTAVHRAVSKQKPPEGWPERPVKKRRKRKTK